MGLAYYSGFDLNRLGTFSVVFTDTHGTFTATVAANTFAHVDMQTVMGTGNYDDIATALQTAMNATFNSFPFVRTAIYTVTFSTTTFLYTIAVSSGTVSIGNTTSPVAKNVLGFNSFPTSAAASISSQIRPYYVISPAIGGRSNVSFDYESDEISYDGDADDGNSFGISRTTAPLFHDWTQPFEPRTAVYKRLATTAIPWTYQHMFEHARNIEPLLIQDADGGVGTDDMVCKLTAPGSVFRAQPVTADFDDIYNLNFQTRLVQTTAGISRI